MNVQKMRKIDRYVGAVMCVTLEVVDKFKRILSIKKPLEDFEVRQDLRSVLITKYLGMGSILLSTPMVTSLKEFYPECKITLVTFASNAEFAKQLGLFDKVISFRTSNLYWLAIDVLKMIVKVRRRKIDAVFDLEFFARFSTIISYLSGAKIRVGYYLPSMWRGNLLTHHIHFNPHKHVTEIFGAQLVPFGVKKDFLKVKLTPPRQTEQAMASLEKKLYENGLETGQKLICVNVNASDLCIERKWPIENFAGLIKYILRKKQGTKIILVGSKGEKEYVSRVFDSIDDNALKDHIIDMSGRMNMDEFIGLLKKSHFFITNDSGPLHIAASLNIKTVSFFGPETPELYGPVGHNNVVFFSGIYCSPCLNVYNAKTAMCDGNNVCMKEISLSNVINTLERESLL